MVNSTARGTNGYWLKSLVSEMFFRKELRFPTDRRENLVDITEEINAVISESGLDSGVCSIYVPHATSGVVVNENDDPNITLAVALDSVQCEILLEASPVDLNTGNPGLSNCRTALDHGLHLVLANKAPLALAQAELDRLAADVDVGILYSATFCGGLPVLNIVRRDMVCGKILGFRGIFNSTTNFILEEMLKGRSYADALSETQERGIAEADPSIDVGGWDTAAKLVIAANSIVDAMITLADVSVSGIEDVQLDWLEQCRREGSVLKLVATAERIDAEWRFHVEPTPVPIASFLGSCSGWEMAIEIQSDIYGKSFHKLWEREPVPTAASMLRDAVHLATMGRQVSL